MKVLALTLVLVGAVLSSSPQDNNVTEIDLNATTTEPEGTTELPKANVTSPTCPTTNVCDTCVAVEGCMFVLEQDMPMEKGACSEIKDENVDEGSDVYRSKDECDHGHTNPPDIFNDTTTPPTTTEKTTTTPAPNTTTSTTTTTTPPTTTPAPQPSPNTTKATPTAAPTAPSSSNYEVHVGSFFGGMAVAVAGMAVGVVAWKFYKSRTERNYHTL